MLRRIADALELTSSDTVIEIGPGRGALTEMLLNQAGRVIAIEIDRALSELLRQKYGTHPRFSLIESDVLKVNLGEAAGGPFVVAGNVPYNITSPILFHTLRRPRAERAVFLVQREVAERIVAPPGSEEYGALSINVQALARADILFGVGAGAFRPPPRVESAVIRVVPRPDPIVAPADEERFSRLVIEAFTMRRKQMRKIVREISSVDAADSERILEAAGIDPDSRPETLSPEQFAGLLAGMGIS